MALTQSRDIVVVSYYSGLDGYVSSEWTDDKGIGLKNLGFVSTLITSPSGSPDPEIWNKFHQVPSVSWIDFRRELHDSKQSLSSAKLTRRLMAATLGRILDALEKLVLGAHSDGRLTWFFSALPIAIRVAIQKPNSLFLFLGGPSGSHLLSLFLGGVMKRRCVSEFQDPLLSDHMQISKTARCGLKLLEKLLLISNEKLVFTSKVAAKDFNSRHSFSSRPAVSILPGSLHQKSDLPHNPPRHKIFDFTFVHIGTLYGSRNLDLLLQALSSIECKLEGLRVGVVNVGYVEEALKIKYDSDHRVEMKPTLSRLDAIDFATQCDATLLIQHDDVRSEVTIPYKFYDYLNIGLPCLALVRSVELMQLSEAHGVCAISVGSDVAGVGSVLLRFLNSAKERKILNTIVFEEQIQKLVED